jgi:hypothetical protein
MLGIGSIPQALGNLLVDDNPNDEAQPSTSREMLAGVGGIGGMAVAPALGPLAPLAPFLGGAGAGALGDHLLGGGGSSSGGGGGSFAGVSATATGTFGGGNGPAASPRDSTPAAPAATLTAGAVGRMDPNEYKQDMMWKAKHKVSK